MQLNAFVIEVGFAVQTQGLRHANEGLARFKIILQFHRTSEIGSPGISVRRIQRRKAFIENYFASF